MRRIVSGRHGKPTSLVRLISSSHQEVQSLLKQGLYDTVARRRYRAEPSNASSAPMQCTRCFRLGHLTSGCCSVKPVCSTFGAKGLSAPQCKQERPRCLLWDKEHSALSRQCSRPAAARRGRDASAVQPQAQPCLQGAAVSARHLAQQRR